MAHFYGTVQGNRGAASRCGSKNSGMTVTANGWDVGAVIEIDHINGRDVVKVYKTSGSNGYGGRQLVAEFEENE